jgi:hypothetical protein
MASSDDAARAADDVINDASRSTALTPPLPAQGEDLGSRTAMPRRSSSRSMVSQGQGSFDSAQAATGAPQMRRPDCPDFVAPPGTLNMVGLRTATETNLTAVHRSLGDRNDALASELQRFRTAMSPESLRGVMLDYLAMPGGIFSRLAELECRDRVSPDTTDAILQRVAGLEGQLNATVSLLPSAPSLPPAPPPSGHRFGLAQPQSALGSHASPLLGFNHDESFAGSRPYIPPIHALSTSPHMRLDNRAPSASGKQKRKASGDVHPPKAKHARTSGPSAASTVSVPPPAAAETLGCVLFGPSMQFAQSTASVAYWNLLGDRASIVQQLPTATRIEHSPTSRSYGLIHFANQADADRFCRVWTKSVGGTVSSGVRAE